MAYNYNSPLTGTDNKKYTEEKTYNIIDKILFRPRNWWIGLVGHVEELERHIELCKNIGIPSTRMMIVERDKRIFLDLKKEATKYGCFVRKGDFKDILLKSSSYSFSLIDYDGTDALSQNEIDLIDIYRRNLYRSGVLRIVASVRKETPEEFKKISDQLHLEHFYRPIFMSQEIRKKVLMNSAIPESKTRILNDKENVLPIYTFTYPTDPMIIEAYCDNNNLNCLYENYRGKGTMRNLIISGNAKLLNYTNILSPGIYFKEVNIGGNTITKMRGRGNELTKFYNIEGKIYYGQELVAVL
jgi:hypothetical protein